MAKQKLKTNRSAAKRMKVTGTGKVKRGQAGKRHLLTSKGPSRKGSLNEAVAGCHGEYEERKADASVRDKCRQESAPYNSGSGMQKACLKKHESRIVH